MKEYFITALSQLLTDRTALLEDGRLILKELLDTTSLDADSESLLQEMDVVAGMIRQMVNVYGIPLSTLSTCGCVPAKRKAHDAIDKSGRRCFKMAAMWS